MIDLEEQSLSSTAATCAAWQAELPPKAKLVLLAIAAGWGRPAVIAEKTGLPPKAVQFQTAVLKRQALIRRHGPLWFPVIEAEVA